MQGSRAARTSQARTGSGEEVVGAQEEDGRDRVLRGGARALARRAQPLVARPVRVLRRNVRQSTEVHPQTSHDLWKLMCLIDGAAQESQPGTSQQRIFNMISGKSAAPALLTHRSASQWWPASAHPIAAPPHLSRLRCSGRYQFSAPEKGRAEDVHVGQKVFGVRQRG